MSIRRRRCAEALLSLLLAGAARAAEPTWAGLELGSLHVEGLTVTEHVPAPPERGGTERVYADASGEVRAVFRFAVMTDAVAAERVVEGWLGQMSLALQGREGVFATPEDTAVLGHHGNLAYSVLLLPVAENASPALRASELARRLLARAVPGRPSPPAARLQLLPDLAKRKRTVRVDLDAPLEARVVLRPSGGTLIGSTLQAWGDAPASVEAVVEDALGRVTVVTAQATLR